MRNALFGGSFSFVFLSGGLGKRAEMSLRGSRALTPRSAFYVDAFDHREDITDLVIVDRDEVHLLTERFFAIPDALAEEWFVVDSLSEIGRANHLSKKVIEDE